MLKILPIFVAFIAFFSAGFLDASATEYYQCSVKGDSSKGASCEAYQGRAHICQLYEGYSGSGVPEFCSTFCVERSGIPEKCAIVSVESSINPEAHEDVLNKMKGYLPFDSIASFFKTQADVISKWWRGEIQCEGNIERPQVGEVLEVKGDGKAWIERGLDMFRVVRSAPLRSGDVVKVPEGMSLKIQTDQSGTISVGEKTKIIITSGKQVVQCLRGRIGSAFTNTLGRMWNWASEKLQGESFEIFTPTVTAGVRG